MPDLITTAKGIAGGLPLAAVTGRAEIMDAVHTGGLGGTYGGNPVACAAALGAIAHHARARPGRRRAGHRDDHEGSGSRAMQARHDVIGDIRGRGAMIAMELVKPGTTEPEPRAGRRHRQGLPRRRCRGADRGYLRQRAAFPAAAGDPAGPADRGPGRASSTPSTPWRPDACDQCSSESTSTELRGKRHGCDGRAGFPGTERGPEGTVDRRQVDLHRRLGQGRGPVDREGHRRGRGRLPGAGHRGAGRRGRRVRRLGRDRSRGRAGKSCARPSNCSSSDPRTSPC